MYRRWVPSVPALIAVLIGVIITYVSGLFPNEYVPVVGVRGWGHPLPWLTEAVVAVPPPREVSLVNGLVDVFFWQLVVYAVFLGARRILRS